MDIFANSSDKAAPRGFPWMWYIRFVQVLLTVIVIAIAARVAATISNGDSGDCHVPHKVVWNIFCGVFAFIALTYFLLATGPSNAFKCLPWLIWIQLGLDAFMFIIWIAAAATSHLNCDDLCNACTNDRAITYFLTYDNLWCACRVDYLTGNVLKRSSSLKSRGLRNGYPKNKTGILAAKTAINALMVVLFAITLGATISWILWGRQHTKRGTPGPTTQASPSDPESGVPMAITQNQGTVVPGPQMQQQSQYPTSQGQPQASIGPSQPQPSVTSGLSQPPSKLPVPFSDQIAPPGPHPQAQYELPPRPKY